MRADIIILTLAIICSCVSSAYAFDPLSGDYSKDDALDVRIVAYNHARNFIDNSSTDAEFNRILVALNPDIVCFEEFVSTVSVSDVANRMNSILPTPGGWHVHFGLLGGIRTVLVSRFPLTMTRIDTIPASSSRGVTIALADLPDATYADDIYLLGVHLKCCGDAGGSEDESRQDSADAIANWLGDARGVVRASGDNVVLAADTPMIVLGDFNMVGGPQPEATITTGDIQDEATYGVDVSGDWDVSDMTDLMPADPFTGDTFTWQGNQSFPPSALDRMFYTDSVATIANSFVLNTDTMSAPALAAAGLQAGDTLSNNTSDHLPIVMDLRMSSATCLADPDCDDGVFCNGAETCDGNSTCQPGTDPCPGDLCNELLDECGSCSADGDCDDGNACTTDTCAAGACQNACPILIDTFPHSENFDSDFGPWSNTSGDDIDWTRLSGATPSSGTGPSNDHTSGSGSYAYTEASTANNGSPDKTAILQSPCVDLTGASAASLTFWYHMLGTSLGTLDVEISDECSTWTSVFNVSGNQGDQWIQANIDITAHVGTVKTIRFRGVTGSSWSSDIAIDDIELTIVPGCSIDDDCDDGVFCNGPESCNAGTCNTGSAPCVTESWCRESDDSCIPFGNGDFEPDGDVDLTDYAMFMACFGQPASGGCESANMSGDEIIDIADLQAFVGQLAGPN
ncbi:MAG: hypothetical protein DHS20C16_06480 [Phycisphaerae bacterium]|nr:MAG: hypothetical protein DHS20C16_06480 [Phycisphaerae bacterium]